jgi:Flp pilus assembly protein TadG
MNLKATLRSESGTSLIEFALVAPVLIFMLIGLIEVGRYAYFSIVAANAARAGVQYGAQSLTTAQDTAGMTSAALQDGQNIASFTASPAPLCSENGGALQACTTNGTAPASGTVYYVKVQVSGTFKSLLSYPGIPTNVPISGSAVMRVISQ